MTSTPSCSSARSTHLPKKKFPPITWIPRDEQGFTILSAPLGGWCAVPGKAVACTVISYTGWYHRPSNCTNYYLSLESGKGKRRAGESLQDVLETGKATPHSIALAAELQVPSMCLIWHHIWRVLINHSEQQPNRKNMPVI